MTTNANLRAGTKVTYLGRPGEITGSTYDVFTGRTTYNVRYTGTDGRKSKAYEVHMNTITEIK
jgi:hypothetical protein